MLNALSALDKGKQVYCYHGFYSLHDTVQLAERRQAQNRCAAGLLPKAEAIAALLYRFPFVRGVGISGSLSKECADANSDFDYFVITSPGYLWIARTLLHILKKISFLRGRQHWYCMNYFVDEHSLHMPEKNTFIALEIVTLKPVCGSAIHQLYHANGWVSDFLPNYRASVLTTEHNTADPWYKKAAEAILANRLGRYADHLLMSVTRRRWNKKEAQGKRTMQGKRMSLATGRHFARPCPGNFQQDIMEMYSRRCLQINDAFLPDTGVAGHFLRSEMM